MSRATARSAASSSTETDARMLMLLARIADGIDALRDDMRQVPTESSLLGATELARLLDVNARTLRQLRHAGDAPPSITIGRVSKWRRADVHAWLDEKARE